MQAFIVQRGGSSLAFYEDLSDATSVMRVTCLVIQCVLGDCVVVSSLLLPTFSLLIFTKIWRLYVVYGKRFWVIIPALLLVISYTGTVFDLGSRVITRLTCFVVSFSCRLCRYLVHSEGAPRQRFEHLQRGEIMDNCLFLHDDVYQRHLFR